MILKLKGITKEDYGRPLYDNDRLFITSENIDKSGVQQPPQNISAGPRIGISKAVDVPWRFWLTDSEYISVKPPRAKL